MEDGGGGSWRRKEGLGMKTLGRMGIRRMREGAAVGEKPIFPPS